MNEVKKVHFIGIGGIGISALAQLFHHEGWIVTGTNDNPSPQTLDRIRALGVEIYEEYNVQNIAPDTKLIVYSDAWETMAPDFMKEVRALGIRTISYFQALGEVSKNKMTVAVAGTHGKTTTTSMLAKILKDAGVSPTVIVGSIVKDFDSNYVPGTSDVFVVEACEYRNHLLELSPKILVITNLEWDHTDYFHSLEALQETFRKAIERVPTDGVIVTDLGNKNIAPLLQYAKAKIVDYTQEPKYKICLEGEFNESNARAAVAAARALLPTISDSVIAESLASFHGTWRRFEYKGKTAQGAEVYDDYAHHPTAVRATLRALCEKIRKASPYGKIIVAFHPHLYSRTRDLLDEFSTAFVDADQVLIAPIYAAREVDDGTISSEILAGRIRASGTPASALDSFEEIEQALAEAVSGDTVMTIGAGDIYKVADALVEQ
jgi:UDP-N-acetylmuramate--alanine ligase